MALVKVHKGKLNKCLDPELLDQARIVLQDYHPKIANKIVDMLIAQKVIIVDIEGAK